MIFSIYTVRKELYSIFNLLFNKNYKETFIEEHTCVGKSKYLIRYINEYMFLWGVYNNQIHNLKFTDAFSSIFRCGTTYFNVVYDVDFKIKSIANVDEIINFPDEEIDTIYNEYIKLGGTEIKEYYTKEKPDFNNLLNRNYILTGKLEN